VTLNANQSETLLITASAFDASAEAVAFQERFHKAGAIVTFLGQVRGRKNDQAVSALRLEYYPDFTEKTILNFAERAMTQWPLTGLRIVHRVGDIASGETIVFVAAAADHRREAFEAVDFLMDFLKSEAPFWKQEITANGAQWVEPRKADYEAKARWQRAASSDGEKHARNK